MPFSIHEAIAERAAVLSDERIWFTVELTYGDTVIFRAYTPIDNHDASETRTFTDGGNALSFYRTPMKVDNRDGFSQDGNGDTSDVSLAFGHDNEPATDALRSHILSLKADVEAPLMIYIREWMEGSERPVARRKYGVRNASVSRGVVRLTISGLFPASGDIQTLKYTHSKFRGINEAERQSP